MDPGVEREHQQSDGEKQEAYLNCPFHVRCTSNVLPKPYHITIKRSRLYDLIFCCQPIDLGPVLEENWPNRFVGNYGIWEDLKSMEYLALLAVQGANRHRRIMWLLLLPLLAIAGSVICYLAVRANNATPSAKYHLIHWFPWLYTETGWLIQFGLTSLLIALLFANDLNRHWVYWSKLRGDVIFCPDISTENVDACCGGVLLYKGAAVAVNKRYLYRFGRKDLLSLCSGGSFGGKLRGRYGLTVVEIRNGQPIVFPEVIVASKSVGDRFDSHLRVNVTLAISAHVGGEQLAQLIRYCGERGVFKVRSAISQLLKEEFDQSWPVVEGSLNLTRTELDEIAKRLHTALAPIRALGITKEVSVEVDFLAQVGDQMNAMRVAYPFPGIDREQIALAEELKTI